MISPEKAQEMIGKLSDFMRGSVKREGEEVVKLEDELNYIESYLSIESVRFGDRLRVNLVKNIRSNDCIPPYLFQPILENAIKFGLYGNTGQVNIDIEIERTEEVLTLKISNPYDPLVQPPRGTGFGLKAVGRRLYLVFARTDLLETHKDNNTFTTILKIPQSNA
jgi:LytS/YehU family sensor histidine kinase